MHIIATSTLVLVAGSVYRFRRTRSGGMLGLLLGTLAMGFIMMPANHIITPYFTGWPTEAVDALLLPGILPFNLLKAGLNSVVTFLLYKTVSRYIVHGEGWSKPGAPEGLTRKPALQKPPPERCSSGGFFSHLLLLGRHKQIRRRGEQVLALQHGKARVGNAPLQLLHLIESYVGHRAGVAFEPLLHAHFRQLLPQTVGGGQKASAGLEQAFDAGQHGVAVLHVAQHVKSSDHIEAVRLQAGVKQGRSG